MALRNLVIIFFIFQQLKNNFYDTGPNSSGTLGHYPDIKNPGRAKHKIQTSMKLADLCPCNEKEILHI